MNYPVFVVAIVMTIAVIGHVFIGTKEAATLEPEDGPPKRMANWVQTLAAFQMLTVDLLIITTLLYLAALSNMIPSEPLLIKALAAYFLLQGIIWLAHILWLKRPGATVLSLPHWLVWFACAGLLWTGA